MEGPDPLLEDRITAALDGGDAHAAASLLVRGYGPGILGYLLAILRDETLAGDAFSAFGEDVWRGLAGFRRASTVRAWAYRIAWHAAARSARDPYRRRARPLTGDDRDAVIAEVRSTTAAHLRTSNRDGLAALRCELTADEQTLLVLRIDRRMAWSEIAEVMDTGLAALRKRYERLTVRLRELARQRGLGS